MILPPLTSLFLPTSEKLSDALCVVREVPLDFPGWGSALDPAGGAYSATRGPIAGFKEPYFYGEGKCKGKHECDRDGEGEGEDNDELY